MYIIVSSQGEAAVLREESLVLFFYVLSIDGHGCVSPRGRYVPKGYIPLQMFLYLRL